MANYFKMKKFAEDVVKKLYDDTGMDTAIRLQFLGLYEYFYRAIGDNEKLEEFHYVRKRSFSDFPHCSFGEFRFFQNEVNKILIKDIYEGDCSCGELFKRMYAYYSLNMGNLQGFSDYQCLFKFKDKKKNFVQSYVMHIKLNRSETTFAKYFRPGEEINYITCDDWLEKHLAWMKLLD